jgi:hypothetical protein
MGSQRAERGKSCIKYSEKIMYSIAAAFVAMELACVALSWLVALRMRTEVNERLAREEQISVWMIHRAYWRMARLHQKFYPASRLRIAFLLCLTGFVVFAVGSIKFSK